MFFPYVAWFFHFYVIAAPLLLPTRHPSFISIRSFHCWVIAGLVNQYIGVLVIEYSKGVIAGGPYDANPSIRQHQYICFGWLIGYLFPSVVVDRSWVGVQYPQYFQPGVVCDLLYPLQPLSTDTERGGGFCAPPFIGYDKTAFYYIDDFYKLIHLQIKTHFAYQ